MTRTNVSTARIVLYVTEAWLEHPDDFPLVTLEGTPLHSLPPEVRVLAHTEVGASYPIEKFTEVIDLFAKGEHVYWVPKPAEEDPPYKEVAR